MKSTTILLLVCFLLLSCNLCKAEWLLSNSAKVSFINCKSGSKPYSAFGHSALRFTDSINKFDVVFNYGAFNSSVQEFYVNFLSNNLNFYLVIERMQDFVTGYIEEGREVTEIPLLLSQNDKQQIFNFLMWNAEAENAAYSYNFLNNNCATRLRDVLETKPVNKIQLDYSNSQKTIRQLLNEHLNEMPWMKFTFYLLLGLKSDMPVSAKQATFLPEYLKKAMLASNDGSKIIAGSERVILKGAATYIKSSVLTQPVFVISAALLLVFCTCFLDKKKLYVLSIGVMLMLTGIIGCLLCYLWFFTTHTLSANNLNLLWALPFNVLLALALIFTHNGFVLRYTKYYGTWLILTGLFTFFSPQEFYPALKFWIFATGCFLFWSSKKLISLK